MKELITYDKSMEWYLEQMDSHVREIMELHGRGNEIYKGDETCAYHARVEAYDLIVLTAEAFRLPGIIERVPREIIERFNRKRSKN
jgi:hypothetical protein